MPKSLTHFEDGYLPLNSGKMYYQVHGSGEPLVFVHGMGLDHRMWDEQVAGFCKMYQVISYDLRGFGKSSLPDAPYNHPEDLIMLLDFMGIEKAHYIGLSMGARVVTDLSIMYPERVCSITLVDSVLHGYKQTSMDLMAISTAAREVSPKAANQLWFEHALFAPARRNPEVAPKLKQMIDDYTGWHWVNTNPWTPLSPPSIEQLDKIDIPTLILIGEEDLLDFQITSDILEKGIKGGRKTVIPKVGHMSNMENSTAFNEFLADFIENSGK